jgi:hypothetical protein
MALARALPAWWTPAVGVASTGQWGRATAVGIIETTARVP